MSYDETFGESDAFNLMKRFQRMMEEIEKASKDGSLRGNWEIKQIDRPGVKGYSVQGRFGSNQPFEPLDPFNPLEPLDPLRRRPTPRRPFQTPQSIPQDTREPLTDVFDEEKAIKIYMEVPGEEKNDIQLNVTSGKVEVKAKNFYKTINLPTSEVNLDEASSRYRNGVLQVTIPKKEKTPEEDARRIKIE